MGAGYFKPLQDRDLIVHWSTFWDFPIAWGTISEFELTDEQVGRIERWGSTWADMPVRYDDSSDGIIFRDSGKGPSGYLPWTNVPAMLELLLQGESEEHHAAMRALLSESGDD